MRPYSENHTENEMDLLMFRYLEKDLTAEETLAFEEKLVADPALQVELELWKESVIEPEFFDTTLLEKELLQPNTKLIDTTLSYHIFVSIIVFFVSAFNPIGANTGSEVKFNSLVGEQVFTNELPAKNNNIEGIAINIKAVENTPVISQVPVISTYNQERSLTEIAELPMRPMIDTENKGPVLSSELPKVAKKKEVKIVTLTRKQRREISRMKEKARQDRKAAEFRKGNRPYVVPLDMSNF